MTASPSTPCGGPPDSPTRPAATRPFRDPPPPQPDRSPRRRRRRPTTRRCARTGQRSGLDLATPPDPPYPAVHSRAARTADLGRHHQPAGQERQPVDAVPAALRRPAVPPTPAASGNGAGPWPVRGAEETALMPAHAIDALVTEEGGSAMTAAKLEAARTLGLMVVVVDRPPVTPGVPVVESVKVTVAHLDR
ncbi:precorrin-6A/cobalt-precorrin-6A reductase [Plantactinospora sonchi]